MTGLDGHHDHEGLKMAELTGNEEDLLMEDPLMEDLNVWDSVSDPTLIFGFESQMDMNPKWI